MSRRTFGALLLLELRLATRRHKLAVKTRVHPLVLQLVVHALLGLPAALLVVTGELARDGAVYTLAASGEAKLVLWAMGLGGLAALAEIELLWVDRRQYELCAALPVSRAQLLSARAAVLVLLATSYALAFSLASLLLAGWVLPAGLHVLWLLPVQAALAAASGASVFLALCIGVLALLPKRVARTAFLLVRLVVAMAMFAGPYVLMLRGPDAVAGLPAWLDRLPPLWLAAPFAVAARGFEGALCWQVPAGYGYALAMVLLVPLMLRAAEARMVDTARSHAPVATTDRHVATSAWLAPRDRVARAAYLVAPRLIWRDQKVRSAVIGQLLFPVLYLVILMFVPLGKTYGLLVVAPMFLSFSMGLLQMCAYSEHADAAWVLGVLPIDDVRPLWFGLQRYLLLRLVVPAAGVVAVVAAIGTGDLRWGLLALPLCSVFGAAGLEMAHFLLRDAPFSRPMQAGAAASRWIAVIAVMVILFVVTTALVATYLLTHRMSIVLAAAMASAVLLWLAVVAARRRWAPAIEPPAERA